MDEHNIINSLDNGERVTSTYAEIYFDDEHCAYKPKSAVEDNDASALDSKDAFATRNAWISPSDLMIGKIDLVPPFTSRITRGITHDGILKIGQAVLDRERVQFLKHLTDLLAENDAAWTQIQEEEKKNITEKVRLLYERIFVKTSATMQKEMSWFYEDTLRELENHLRSQVRTILISTHCSMINDLNKEIKERLLNEKHILEKELRKKYDKEVRNMNKYYKLLLHNEKHRGNRLVNQALGQRNEALKIFCSQMEAEATTSTMYVMSTERKKCRMRQFLLENFHSDEIEAKLKDIKRKQDILEDFQRNKRHILDINREWEDKVKKILQLFLKFISYSLKLLPEQTSFLLDLERMVVLQLNEIQKHPEEAASILIAEDDLKNIFEFHEPEKQEVVCTKEPFVIEGDLTPSVSTQYGSQESIPLHKELPYFRVQRQFIYAKCQKIQQVWELLHPCKCHELPPSNEPIEMESNSLELEQPTEETPHASTSTSNELFLVDDIARLQHCPSRGCQDYINRLSFPNLDDYLDFTQKKFLRVQAILGHPATLQPAPTMLDPKEIVRQELPFAATKERYRTVETQYSSQAELLLPEDLTCPCMEKTVKADEKAGVKAHEQIDTILTKRRESLKRLMHENPKLLQLFGEESYDFVY